MSDALRADAGADWDKQKESFLKFYDGAPLATVARLAHEAGYVAALQKLEKVSTLTMYSTADCPKHKGNPVWDMDPKPNLYRFVTACPICEKEKVNL